MKKETKIKIKLWLAGILGAPLLRLFFYSLRVKYIGKEKFENHMTENDNCILVFWHGIMLGPFFDQRGKGFNTLISQHGDGEILSLILEKIGYSTIRGSSTRGGKEALSTMVDILNENSGNANSKKKCMLITPDGPKGPVNELKMGAVVLAQRTNTKIIPVSYHCQNNKKLRSWDSFLLPKLFSKAIIIYGDPIVVEKGIEGDALDKVRKNIEKEMHIIDEIAVNYYN